MKDKDRASCVSNRDETQSYYKLYGNLYFTVPHYVKSYEETEYGIYVEYSSGCKMSIGKPIGVKI